MTPGDDWNSPFFRMGSGESKKTDNVVGDTVDFSTNMSKDFAVLRLHGGTSALVASVAASAILVYMAYRMFKWKKAQMDQARRRAPQGEGRVSYGAGQGEWTWRVERGRAGLPGDFLQPIGPPSLQPCYPCQFMWTSATTVGRRDMMS